MRGGTSNLPGPCNPAGLAFGPDGRLFIADTDRIMVLKPDAAAPPTATVHASGVPGANGVAFDRRGDLWVSDGTTAQGRVWRIGRDQTPVETFRVQPLANDVVPGGVGRDVRGLPPGTTKARSSSPPTNATRSTRVPDEPGPPRPQAVPDPFGRRPPRQFPQRTRRRGKGVMHGLIVGPNRLR
jgi:hypothetical protein